MRTFVIIKCKYFTTPSHAKCQIINYHLAKLFNGNYGRLWLEIWQQRVSSEHLGAECVLFLMFWCSSDVLSDKNLTKPKHLTRDFRADKSVEAPEEMISYFEPSSAEPHYVAPLSAQSAEGSNYPGGEERWRCRCLLGWAGVEWWSRDVILLAELLELLDQSDDTNN